PARRNHRRAGAAVRAARTSQPRPSPRRGSVPRTRKAPPPMSRTATLSHPIPSGIPATAEERFLRYKRELHQQLIAGMDLSAIGAMDESELRIEVRHAAEELCRNSSDLLNLSERERLVSEVLDETFGLGPLEPLIRDPTITDILINGPKMIYVERSG